MADTEREAYMARLLDRVELEADAWKVSDDPGVRSCGEWLGYLLDHGFEHPLAVLDRAYAAAAEAARSGPPHPQATRFEPELMSSDLVRALAVDPTLGGKLHDVHGGPGEDCWCGYVGHEPSWDRT